MNNNKKVRIDGYQFNSCILCGDVSWSKSSQDHILCKECHDIYKHKGVDHSSIDWREKLHESNRTNIRYVVDENECWVCVSHRGLYPRINVMGERIKLHRYMYEKFHDLTLVPEQIIMHLCDNPRCINPKHLKMGTILDNNQDMYNKKRHAWGVKNSHAKLSECEVMQIRADDKKSQFDLAKEFSVSQSTIFDIKNKRSWKLLEVEL